MNTVKIQLLSRDPGTMNPTEIQAHAASTRSWTVRSLRLPNLPCNTTKNIFSHQPTFYFWE